jgi:NAD(P)-dependent dehydrogenase (short-subunit alcohol dehydrogenase family)
MPRPLSQQVVVLTGASSGVGRETALQLARQGTTIVAAARNTRGLESLALEVDRLGGTVTTVRTDVSDWVEVQALARRAVDEHGRIDTWVNCAAVALYGTVADVEVAEIDRVLDVILRGQIYGMKAALSVMQPAGSGTIVNVASALGVRAVPLQSAYCAAKAGIRSFAQSLRMELAHEQVPVRVCTVLPSSINTPLFDHARSRMGVKPQPVPPIYEPSVVAGAVLAVAQRPQDEVVVGGGGKMLTLVERFAPRLANQVLLGPGKAWSKQRTSTAADGVDNLFTPSTGSGAVDGDFGSRAKSSSLYTELLELHPQRIRMALAAAALLGYRTLRR